MKQGKIKRLNPRGFGFIECADMDGDLFFHASSLVGIDFDSIKEGDSVTFDVQESDKGMNAVNVSLAQA